MKYISKFISSIVLLVSLQAFSQEQSTDTVASPVKIERYGIRVGADAYRIARSLFDENYRGFEIVGDYRFAKKFYFAGEIGNEKITVDDDQLNFTTSGTYIKLGVDFNAYENWLDMENMIYAGLRYGFSNY